ncbi:MAG: hypothetical protein R3Y07_06660 [Eubacteriales bacterium]
MTSAQFWGEVFERIDDVYLDETLDFLSETPEKKKQSSKKILAFAVTMIALQGIVRYKEHQKTKIGNGAIANGTY